MKWAALTSTKAAGRRGRAALLIVVSILAHVTVLGLIGFSAPTLRFLNLPEGPPLTVWLTPDIKRATTGAKDSRITPLPRNAAPTIAAAAPAAATPTTPPVLQPAQPVLPSPRSQLQAAPGQAAGAPSDSGGDVGAGVRAALRGRLGCDVQGVARLTAEERARCDQHMAETAKLGPAYVDPVPAEKRAYYDAVQAAYQAAHDPRPGQLTDIGGGYIAWGHPPSIGCAGRRKGDHRSFKEKLQETGVLGIPLGPLSCGLALPQGSLTPEVGIPHP